jgi:galactokinase
MIKELDLHIQEAKQAFTYKFNDEPTLVSAAPGRINIIGEHTDYNFGKSVPAAINKWVCIAAKIRKDKQVNVYSANYDGWYKTSIDKPKNPIYSWQKYILGAIELMADYDWLNHGFDAYIVGNIPIGAGVSSSAAIEVATTNLLRSLYQVNISDIELVKICQKIEHEYIGIKSGLLDQYASLFSKEGYLMKLDFSTLTHEYFQVNMRGHKWVLVNTKVKRELSASKYTERVNETQEGLNLLHKFGILEFNQIKLNDIKKIEDEVIQKRMRHYVTENERVEALCIALKDGDLDEVGDMLLDSHKSLKEDYEVSCEELDFLVEVADSLPYVEGSRMMGGGFGGCTINLVIDKKVSEFSQFIINKYKEKFGIEAEILVFDMVDGAKVYNFE